MTTKPEEGEEAPTASETAPASDPTTTEVLTGLPRNLGPFRTTYPSQS